jgi:hypothetical protein
LLTNWYCLLKSLHKSQNSNHNSNQFFDIFILNGVYEEIGNCVKDQGSLISLIDTEEEVGEVESSDLSSL